MKAASPVDAPSPLPPSEDRPLEELEALAFEETVKGILHRESDAEQIADIDAAGDTQPSTSKSRSVKSSARISKRPPNQRDRNRKPPLLVLHNGAIPLRRRPTLLQIVHLQRMTKVRLKKTLAQKRRSRRPHQCSIALTTMTINA
jgi:hypothetical protein